MHGKTQGHGHDFHEESSWFPIGGAPHATLHGEYRGQSGGEGKWWEMWLKGFTVVSMGRNGQANVDKFGIA